MKNLLLLGLFPFFVTLASAQSGWQLGVDFFPNLSGEVSGNGAQVNYEEQPRFSYSVALHAARELHPRWALFTGFGYANTGDRSESDQFRWGAQHDGMGGFDPTAPSNAPFSQATFISVFEYLEWPVGLRYFPVKGEKIRVFLTAGAATRLFLSQSNVRKTDSADGASASTGESGVDYDTFSPGLLAGAGLEARLSSRFAIVLEPRAQYHFIRGDWQDVRVRSDYLAAGLAVRMAMQL